MKTFYKYHGAGNDFIMIDNRDGHFDIDDIEHIKLVCHRRFGVGADGIMLVEKHPEYDFRMMFINSDGSRGSMCGNGARCIVSFAHNILKIIKNPDNIVFETAKGMHRAMVLKDGQIKLKMNDIKNISTRNDLPFTSDTGTPHNVIFVENIYKCPVIEIGRKLRYEDPDGVNANFVEIKNNIYNVRTYERGVEDETLACGTGSTSVAIVSHQLGFLKENICHIKQPGGDLTVEFDPPKNKGEPYTNIWLTGPAVCVFKGEWENK